MIARLSIAGALALFSSAGLSRGEPPKVESLFPAGGQRGAEFEVTANGKLDPWPVQAVCDREGIVFSPGEKAGTYRVAIGEGVEPGVALVRFVNAEGATPPRQFVVGAVPERLESELAQTALSPADFPLAVNGKLESGDQVDRFALELQAGQLVVAEVAAYALDSPLDPLLHLRGPRGEQLAFNHDATRLGLDPRLVFTAPADGTYELQLAAFAYPPQANIRFTGGANAAYRLSFHSEAPRIELPPPCEAESEEPQFLEIPAAISGTIEPAGDVDRYRFAATKGRIVRIEILAAQLGSWMDPVLTITDSAGKELKSEDDIDRNTNPDVDLAWTAPADGEFLAEVRDLNGNGGAEIAYRLRITRPEPDFGASAAGDVYAVAPGKSVEVVVKVVRRFGYEGELEVRADGLPPGVTAEPAAVNDKGDATLTLAAAPDAPPHNGPFTLWVAPPATPDQRVPCRFQISAPSTALNQAWLTITAE